MKEFNSEFCNVKYIEKDKVVLLTWKKFCFKDDYRKPVLYAVDLINNYQVTDFVVDARNGFEDDKDDVKWGFDVYLPALAKTSCKNVIFIMEKVNDIQGEMDMWTKEFMKYFKVIKVESFDEYKNK